MSSGSEEVRPHPDVLIQRMPNGEAVLLNMETEVYYGLDPVGAGVWEALADTGKVSDAVERLHERFPVERGRLETDVRALVSELAEAGLLIVLEPE